VKTNWIRRIWEYLTGNTLKCLIRKIMATIEEVKQELEDIKGLVANVGGDVDSLIAQVAALTAEVAAGKVATQEDLDALAASAQAIKDSLTATDAKEPPVKA
jgi:predicted  nucleic acid-binding Zn-ribbon protein